jgi:hypothetical protein
LPFPEVALKNGVVEIRAKNPNLSFTNAYNQLMREQPKLFVTGDDVGIRNRHQWEIINEGLKLMKANPGMERETAHNLLMQKRPEFVYGPVRARNPKREDGERRKGPRKAGGHS